MKFRSLLSPRMLHASRASRCPVFRSLLKTVPMRPPVLLVRGRRARVPPRTNDPAAPRRLVQTRCDTGSSPAAGLTTLALATRILTVGRTPRDTTEGPHCMRCRLPGARMSTPAFPFLRRFIGHAQNDEATQGISVMSSPLTHQFAPITKTYVGYGLSSVPAEAGASRLADLWRLHSHQAVADVWRMRAANADGWRLRRLALLRQQPEILAERLDFLIGERLDRAQRDAVDGRAELGSVTAAYEVISASCAVPVRHSSSLPTSGRRAPARLAGTASAAPHQRKRFQ